MSDFDTSSKDMANLFKGERLSTEPKHHIFPPGVLERIHENMRIKEEERQRNPQVIRLECDDAVDGWVQPMLV